MAEESGIYTIEQLDELDDKINYMIFGQGFAVCVVDTKPTRRRTLTNMLKKIGVEIIVEAETYEKTLVAIKKVTDNKLLVLAELEMPGKMNGFRIITDIMSRNKGMRGVILTDEPNPKLEQITKVTRAIEYRVRPVKESDLKELITGFGFRLEKP